MRFPLQMLVCTAACLSALLSGCGGEDGPALRPPRHTAKYAPGTVIGQEVWVPYAHPSHAERGIQTKNLPSREQARERAEKLRQRVLDGADLADLAFRESQAPGSFVGGFTGLLPRRPDDRDVRDRALLSGRPGQLSEVLEWEHGFWFGAPVSAETGARLRRRFEDAARIRARARMIYLGYAHARPRRYEFDKFPKTAAVAAAERLIERLAAGEDFAKLARERSNEPGTRKRGGAMMQPALKDGGDATEWIQWRAWRRHYPYPVLEAVLETAPVGEVLPKPLVTDYGVMVIEVLERQD